MAYEYLVSYESPNKLKNMKFRNLLTLIAFYSSIAMFSQIELYKKVQLEGVTRVSDLIQRLTLEEKIAMISGTRTGAYGPGQYDGSVGNERLEIPPFKMYRGAYGVNASPFINKVGTYYPVPINMAATWNRRLIEKVTNSLSKELSASGGQSNIGPSLNIIRDLRDGSSFENFTEDPYLNGQIASAYVRGIQSERNIAVLKHFVCSNQEREQNYMDVKVSERALREIYLPGFKHAVMHGGALGVMTGYNSINGVLNADNERLIKEVLKKEWDFKGFVTTDLNGSGTSAESMVQAGIDFEVSSNQKLNKEAILKALQENRINENQIDDMVKRILVATFVTGVLDEYRFENPALMATRESTAIAKDVAEESIILLQNKENILPIDRKKTKTIAVIGPNGSFGNHYREGAKAFDIYQGGGSAVLPVQATSIVTPLAGLRKAANGTSVLYQPGCYGDNGCTEIKEQFFTTQNNRRGLNASYYSNDDFEGTAQERVDTKVSFDWGENRPAIVKKEDDTAKDLFSVRWTGNLRTPKSRLYTFEIQSQGAAKIYIDKKLVVNKRKKDKDWDKFAMGEVFLEKGTHEVKIEYKKTTSVNAVKLLWDYGSDAYLAKAVALAQKSKVVVMPLGNSGLIESEKIDRDERLNKKESLLLSTAQERLINEVAKVNPNIVVVTYSAGVISENWRNKVKAIVHAGFPGQEGGNALANILYGKTNPSGKLPISIPKSVRQYSDSLYSYTRKINYKEGIYVGYRHFDKKNIAPAFPFGHGLSYTNFTYSNLVCVRPAQKLDMVSVSVEVKNTGNKEGKEVVQVYVNDVDSTVDRPKKELKAFRKINLKPGESKVVKFMLKGDAFSFFDVEKNKWVLEPGQFNIMVGSSSQDIKQTSLLLM